MNDNIRAIWNQAASSHQQAETSRETQENFINRFAELIVEECCGLIYDRGEHSNGSVTKYKIRKHFGMVE